ncbi:MAG: hypothetical protein UR85_C0004G0024 [Candidatus Nomurabacteria bacterium GW2011_GWF2_35_66]|uniref:Pilus assembly protein, PilO n=1 Tax=Candidatus Nomurabacteria bacterium GW2011_GWE1_35_16 TaxID=1618761 RepID=A0A0G0BBR6_9BACT|nr:MAG: hypothetical protein UR55_C0002G0023 [Candidatus Nomurabacteria bacterium GW2011_GWF1_34_20]KKP63602.1 MAG: hypothetical protein UR57_C0002G0023 [Candidatus Nomurabacteria bacterium GW2011_GWE2_34_25]KKP66804.1 MAG: hypothetical protein UR64_C0002G0020 [Candidatus Nomurabacteria bacterium GW2011_GWE1_35_16]KKP83430.1 MAG: hypothetical protein UR85_C0004G0024 [Candidatus Nomurabacteria bacterium GW2011_GWF2_35_66]HAE36638.1 hypothetical protein [Candidatus Nomurabacteria bacterium]
MKFIFSILFILISIAVFIFGVNPFYKQVSILRDDIVVYNTALSNSTNLQKTEDSLIKTYNGIKQSDKDRLDKFLPDSVDNIQFILEIERIANLHHMPIKDIKFEPIRKSSTLDASTNTIVSAVSTDTRPFGVFEIQFTTEGDYDSFILFLKDLESNLRLVDVKAISFVVPINSGKIAKGEDPNIYKYSLKVETYWLK